ncbi:cupredoxin domain-containing protein [Sinorhizobium sp. RAC02]|uniref:cupredoxin domain-containing protein n=1 Tax=Sinorhizobium sp. RAC02 TaxID=1842534 RepID=UPI0008588062|nr:cupredoxin domain-containing protein [Sinorhizobium sp. RAC02]AOF91947.1 copper binding s, plastocyanin/azurin family protein [Sinorhizobium sp. RAC02]
MTPNLLNRRQILITGAAVLTGSALARAHNGTVHVTIEKLAFLPAEIEVRAGETIEWANKDPFAHTATVKGGWEVLIPPGKVATHVATAGDTVDYYCRFHPNMSGRITVKA